MISIHALQAESDVYVAQYGDTLSDFDPRSPSGERPLRREGKGADIYISIHALQAESDDYDIETF